MSELEQNKIERKHQEMSKLMKQIKAANPSLGQIKFYLWPLSMQLSQKKMVGGGGLYLQPYPRGRGK